MTKETLSIEVKLPQAEDEAFKTLVDQLAEAVYQKVTERLSKVGDSESGDLENPALT
ncbi:hypothetical protein LU640_25590 [Pseudomonas monteilii]|uniref:hypothetical protein n=1 Tax=Pseudomonas monteilii TaxID=76759 RepID=UPI001E441EF6|nr:hypothetical protein [Pseudomonas monteilii]MCE1020522.1 hypothetical protein [Pseudomonas monteilii]MCE1037910.1 hypothetical protein [Pseudomonas monteilii]MCE1089999.1 hypothetical protein [Pseudomonas monteilii]MDH0023899.1 hypothetical protein [Pseudomonas monteilii]